MANNRCGGYDMKKLLAAIFTGMFALAVTAPVVAQEKKAAEKKAAPEKKKAAEKKAAPEKKKTEKKGVIKKF
jgi:ribosomal protein L12E/L44/L45/RPP1/RPP2